MLRDPEGPFSDDSAGSAGIHPSNVAVIFFDLGRPIVWVNRRIVGNSETGWVQAWIRRRMQERAVVAILREDQVHP